MGILDKFIFTCLFRMNKHIPDFTGPYITHKPDIRIFEIDKTAKYLILGSDGLWDELKEKEVKRK